MKKKQKKSMVTLFNKYEDVADRYSTKVIKTNLSFPANFRMLCALVEVEPAKVLTDFMWIMSSSYFNEPAILKREAAKDYFIKCRYGESKYSGDDVKKMLMELEAFRVVDETMDGCNSNKSRLFYCVKNFHLPHWFKKWFNKAKQTGNFSLIDQY